MDTRTDTESTLTKLEEGSFQQQNIIFPHGHHNAFLSRYQEPAFIKTWANKVTPHFLQQQWWHNFQDNINNLVHLSLAQTALYLFSSSSQTCIELSPNSVSPHGMQLAQTLCYPNVAKIIFNKLKLKVLWSSSVMIKIFLISWVKKL